MCPSFGLLVVALVMSLVLISSSSSIPRPAHADGTPCETWTEDANPPITQPQPYINGSVIDAGTSAGIAGLTVKLYRCIESAATLVQSQTTGSNGAFGFANLSYPYWYYVIVDTAAVPGLVPVSPSTNPSPPIEVGDGLASLVFVFD